MTSAPSKYFCRRKPQHAPLGDAIPNLAAFYSHKEFRVTNGNIRRSGAVKSVGSTQSGRQTGEPPAPACRFLSESKEKEKTMEYQLKQNVSRGPSTEESRRVRGGAAIQRDGRSSAVAVDEPNWTMSRSIRASSPRRSPAGGSFMSFLTRTLRTQAPRSAILVRLIVGGVFLTEGIQKFLLPGELGVGRFVKIGIPLPEVMAPFVGVVEIVGGTLLLVGLLTRLATIPLIVNMLVAIGTTKIPILFKDGLWKAVHESRVDGSMLLGSFFLLIVGAGLWSLDVWLLARTARTHRE
jgi:putative oxidoreductase